jgi:hypothetical protein
MKYEETFPGLNAEIAQLLKKTVPDSFARNLDEAGVKLALPEDRELELKVKYDIDEDGGSLGLKISWNNEIEEEDEEDDKDEDDKEED